jgi:hypothetical protein
MYIIWSFHELIKKVVHNSAELLFGKVIQCLEETNKQSQLENASNSTASANKLMPYLQEEHHAAVQGLALPLLVLHVEAALELLRVVLLLTAAKHTTWSNRETMGKAHIPSFHQHE